MDIQNQSTQREIRQALALGVEIAPRTATPVVNVNPKDYRTLSFSALAEKSTTGNITVISLSSTNITKICSLTLSFSKDATCDAASGIVAVACTLLGTTTYLLTHATLTLTAESKTATLTFSVPIVPDKGSNITLISPAYTVGAFYRSCTVQGYEVTPFEESQ